LWWEVAHEEPAEAPSLPKGAIDQHVDESLRDQIAILGDDRKDTEHQNGSIIAPPPEDF